MKPAIRQRCKFLRTTGNISHYHTAKHIGIPNEEILELILQVGMYAGWGTMGFALDQFTEVLKERTAAEKAKQVTGNVE